jgi:hypothetical protein
MPAAIRDRGEPSVGGGGCCGAEVGVAELRGRSGLPLGHQALDDGGDALGVGLAVVGDVLGEVQVLEHAGGVELGVAPGRLRDELRRGELLPELGVAADARPRASASAAPSPTPTSAPAAAAPVPSAPPSACLGGLVALGLHAVDRLLAGVAEASSPVAAGSVSAVVGAGVSCGVSSAIAV